MKNIISACSLKQFEEHIEAGILMLQDQDIPINSYTFGFLVNELNRYIAELEHPRYLAYVHGGIMEGVLDIRIHVADKFNQNNWVDSIQFVYPKDAKIANPIPPKSTWEFDPKPTASAKPSIVPVPQVDVFESEVKSQSRQRGYTKTAKPRRPKTKLVFTTYTEYVSVVSALYNKLGCECLNKTLIAAFLGKFSYPEAFVSSGKKCRQHLKLKDGIAMDEEVKGNFEIDWDYFLNNWVDNVILVAQYKRADEKRIVPGGKHRCIDLVETFLGNGTYELTDLGKLLWEKIRDLFGLIDEEENINESIVNEPIESGAVVMSTPAAMVARLGTEEQLEDHVKEKVEEVVKVRHMGYDKCKGCKHFHRHKQWCTKRLGYINTLEHDECFEEEKEEENSEPEIEPATNDVEKVCYNCKRWHSGNNPGTLKVIACRCPIQGRKTLADDTCNKFIAIVRKEAGHVQAQ